MDENGFKTFLKRSRRSSTTIKNYVSYVNRFERWLFKYREKKIDGADKKDINDWSLWAEKVLKTTDPYFYGIREYYRFKSNEVMVNAIDEILSKRPFSPPPSRHSFGWSDFEKVMLEAEKISINDRDRALLNLLWSEMNSSEILGLLISDIDFEKRIIYSRISRKIYHVTQEAWDALEKYVPIQDRDKKTPLFPIRDRRLMQITKKYFESVKQTPKGLMLSCQEDLINTGRKERFVIEHDKKPPFEKEIIETEPKPFSAYQQIEKILLLATKDVKIIDPYVDKSLFPLYFYELPSNVNLKLLIDKMFDKFKIVAQKFKEQRNNFEVRKCSEIHDRYLIIDKRAWIIGQSIKDAGKKPLSIVEIENVGAVLRMFDKLWNRSAKVV